jgi:hypothetical protein
MQSDGGPLTNMGWKAPWRSWQADGLAGKRKRRKKLCLAHRDGRRPERADPECTTCTRLAAIAAAAQRLKARP